MKIIVEAIRATNGGATLARTVLGAFDWSFEAQEHVRQITDSLSKLGWQQPQTNAWDEMYFSHNDRSDYILVRSYGIDFSQIDHHLRVLVAG